MTPKMAWAKPNCVFKKTALPPSPDWSGTSNISLLSMKALLPLFFRKTFPYCHPRNVNLETWMQRCWLCSWGLNWSLPVNFDLAPSLAATAWSTVPVSVLWFQDCFLVTLWVHGFFLACTQLTIKNSKMNNLISVWYWSDILILSKQLLG